VGTAHAVFVTLLFFVTFCSLVVGLTAEQPLFHTEHPFHRKVFAFLLGIWFAYFLLHRLLRIRLLPARFHFSYLFQPFPNWNLFLLLAAWAGLVYPWSSTLQNIGLLPALVVAALVAALCAAIVHRGLEFGTLTAAVALLVSVWIWEMAGRSGLAVLPVDFPDRNDSEFTPEGAAKVLLSEIANWPPPDPVLVEDLELGSQEEEFSARSLARQQLSRRSSSLGLGVGLVQVVDIPLGEAELGGIHLGPIYHTLRHLRHKPTLEAQILFGEGGAWTLALRRSDLPPDCFSDDLPRKLLEHDIQSAGEEALLELRAIVEQDRDNQRKTAREAQPQCNPRAMHKLLAFLGISEIPTGQDERISDVTVAALTGDERLTQLVRRAVFTGMDRIAPASLGLYFDQAGRTDSALFYYRRALPHAILEASQKGSSPRERRRVALLLMRIAELETKPKKERRTEYEESALRALGRAGDRYASAAQLAPEYPPVFMEVGYFLLTQVRSIQRDLSKVDDGTRKTLVDLYAVSALSYERLIADFPFDQLRNDFGSDAAEKVLTSTYTDLAFVRALQAELRMEDGQCTNNPAQEEQADNSTETEGRSCVRLLEEAERNLVLAKEIKNRNRGSGSPPVQATTQEAQTDFVDFEHLATAAYVNLLRKTKSCGELMLDFEAAWQKASLKEPPLVLALLLERVDRGMQECEQRRLWQLEYFYAHADLGIDRFDMAHQHLGQAQELVPQDTRLQEPDRNKLFAHMKFLQGVALWQRACDHEESLPPQQQDDLRQRDLLRQQALSDSTNSIHLNPDQWQAPYIRLALLAMSPSLSSQQAQGALSEIEALARRHHHIAELHQIHGALLLRLNRPKEAVDALSRAVQLSPYDPEIHYFYGFALFQHGQVAQAKDEWAYAKALDPQRWKYISNPLPGCGPRLGL